MILPSTAIDQAHAVPVIDELARRGIRLCGKAELVGPCPICGGTDRFSVNTRKQIWNCRGCAKGGDVIALVQHLDDCSFHEAVATLNGEGAPAERRQPARKAAPQRQDDDAARTARALAIWRASRDPRGTLVETYLAHRGLTLPDEAAGEAIRFHPACPFKGAHTPALVALVRDVQTNAPKAIHRTALTAEGFKAWVDGDDRLALGPVGGGALKLTPDEDVTLCLGIGEGIESTLSMCLAPDFGASPVWSLLSAGQVAAFPVLAGIEALWIAVDHDKAGIEKSRECAERLRRAGREVFLIRPKAAGDDLNDIARRHR